MSDYIPFEIQLEVIKNLPVKSLVRFRSVSKQWKSFIDCTEFIKTYHINRTNQQHHLLVQGNTNTVPTYTLIIDDNTFPQQKFPLTDPEPLNSLRDRRILGSIGGLICFYGLYKFLQLKNSMVVLWNPSVRKCVGITVPNVLDSPSGYLPDGYSPRRYTRIGFGVCPDTNDPKLVKINAVKTPSRCWEVQVFTLSSRVWKTVYRGAPFKSCYPFRDHVFIDGFIYWPSSGCFLLSFDLKSEKFGEVSIPERLASVRVLKVNESLGLLNYNREGEMWVCDLWMRNDGVNQPFTKIYTIKVEGKSLGSVLGFRNNGDVVLRIVGDDYKESTVEVYEPSSGHINGVGIKGDHIKLSACSYIESLLLLDQSNYIIH